MSTPEIRTAHGAVRGRTEGTVSGFHAVPYAAAPVGPLRFAPPAPPRRWSGVRDATSPGPGAPQPPSRLEAVTGPLRLRQSEDCLTVDVWTPSTRGRRPVMVWLHGGAFSSGAGGHPWYDGARLAARGDLVVVTVNYRLGALGFLHLPEEGLGAGNLGLRDQIAALGWVRENITAFGGDPDRVTVAGQSAGALTTLAMLADLATRALFAQAILQSTPTAVAPNPPGEASAIAREYLHLLDVHPGRADRMRELPVAQLLAAQQDLARTLAAPLRIAPPFHLTAAPGLVPADLPAAAASAAHPRLVSVTRDEAAAFLVPNSRRADVDHAGAAALADEALGAGWYAAAHRADPDAEPGWLLSTLFTPEWFGTDVLAPPDTVHRFDWHPAGNPLGACHCIELPFVFDTLAAWREAPMLAGPAPDPDAAAIVQRTWATFVHTGKP